MRQCAVSRFVSVFLVLITALPAFAEVSPTSAVAAERAFSFEGRVLTPDEAPIAGVLVEVVTSTDDKALILAATESDMEGHFMLLAVPLSPGHYQLRFSGLHYSTFSRSIDISAESSTETTALNVHLSPESQERPKGLFHKKTGKVSAVKVFYATDRASAPEKKGEQIRYLGQRSASGLAFGTATVTIPPDHVPGVMEEPSILRLEFSPDAQKHIVISEVRKVPKSEFFQQLASSVAATQNHDAFVFVHGYNVTFEDALKRTAQLAFDMGLSGKVPNGFSGVPIVYSWPSKGVFYGYSSDETEIEATRSHLKEFLKDLSAQSGAISIYLVAHSMGNRALLQVLSELSADKDRSIARPFKQVVFAAPDVASDDFQRLAKNVARRMPHVTLYVSSHDQALLLSRHFHGGAPRAGEAGTPPLLLRGLDTVDASKVSTELLGHTYYGENRSVIEDLIRVLRNEVVPRGLQPIKVPIGTYYVLLPQS